ncbi:MAG: hypothetical protein GY737_14335, partial [Desulfobacteraceae bacterium]|nr:hypothetical protein [Desulfobacteraceae bacterium]
IADYKIQLPYPIELEGSWQVGLAEIQYPVTYDTVRKARMTVVLENGRSETGVRVNDGYYGTIEELLESINFSTFQYGVYRAEHLQDYIKKKRAELKEDETELTEFNRLVGLIKKTITFDYVKVINRVRVTVQSAWASRVVLDAQLQHILGMESAELQVGEMLAKFPLDLKAG